MKRYFSAFVLVFVTGLFLIPSTALFASVANFGQNTTNYGVGSSQGAGTGTNVTTTFAQVTSVGGATIKVSGKRPVLIVIHGDTANGAPEIGAQVGAAATTAVFAIYRDATPIWYGAVNFSGSGSGNTNYITPGQAIIDLGPGQGSHTYYLYSKLSSASSGAATFATGIELKAVEL
jgi:hypothetical protein